jgi:hypothetical protein
MQGLKEVEMSGQLTEQTKSKLEVSLRYKVSLWQINKRP